MPKKDRVEARSDVPEVSVQLKPILGIRPGMYLTVLYALVFLLLVFFLLFYPGLRNRGQYLVVSSAPARATVSVDGVFAGTTPCTVFVKKGDRKLEVSHSWFKPVSSQVAIGGRVFATLIVPDKVRRYVELEPVEAQGLLKAALSDFQRNPTVPQIISDAAWAAYKTPQNRDSVYDFLSDCMYFVQAEPQLREIIVGAGRASSLGQVMTPLGLVSLVQHSVQVKQKYNNWPSWLLLSLSRDNGRKIGTRPWAVNYLAEYRNQMSLYYQASFTGQAGAAGGRGPSLQGIAFRTVPGGTLVMGNDEKIDNLGKTIDQTLPHPVAVASFAMSETEVTNRQFQAFIDANAAWSPASRETLISKGVANDQYLAGWAGDRPAPGTEDLPVTGVSSHAASAYCAWLTARLASSLPGHVVRLPSEAEWEWAARGGLRGMPYPLGEKPGAAVLSAKGVIGPSRAGTSEPNAYGLRDMVGNVWEWCGDSSAPAAYLLSSLDPKQNAQLAAAIPESGDRVVRGGSWNNSRDQVKVYTRGSQPADWCTPYLGFRVVLARP